MADILELDGSRMPRKDVLRWLDLMEWTQADLAKKLGRNASYMSKILRGRATSRFVWQQIRAVMADPEGYQTPAYRSLEQRRKIITAAETLREAGIPLVVDVRQHLNSA